MGSLMGGGVRVLDLEDVAFGNSRSSMMGGVDDMLGLEARFGLQSVRWENGGSG